jgi:ATP-dependent Clp protease protease subunit
MFSYNVESKEILLYGVVGEDWFGEGMTAGAVQEALDNMSGDDVTVRINSPGGVADEGIAIYNTLKRYAGKVNVVIDALAASAASVIAMAGDTRVSLDGSRWMLHNAMGLGIGNAADMRKLASILDIYDESLTDIYANVSGASRETVRDWMAAETWFTANAAVEAKLSTGLSEETTEQEPQMAAWFEHAPQDLASSKAPVAKMKPQAVKRELARLRLRLSER